eukprot:76755_1
MMIASRIQSTVILSAILLIEFHAEAFSVISMSLQQKPPFRPSNRDSSNPYGAPYGGGGNAASTTGTSTTTSTSTHSIIDGSHKTHNVHSTASYLESMSAPATPTATYSPPPSTDIVTQTEEISNNNINNNNMSCA